jgi:hypothetical protein
MFSTRTILSRLQVLIAVSTVMLSFGSCSRFHYKSAGTAWHTEDIRAGIFGENFDKTWYRASIDLNNRHFSGLMLLKKVQQSNSYRMVFLSEIGLKILDMEFFDAKNNGFQVHYCLDAFDRRPIINSIRKDMESILIDFTQETEKEVLYGRNSENRVIKYKLSGQGRCYYSINKDNRVVAIERRGVLGKKGEIAIEYGSGIPPQEIIILHRITDLEIVFTNLKI